MANFNYFWQGGHYPPVLGLPNQASATWSPPTSTQATASAETDQTSDCTTDFNLKVINPTNKKEFQLYTVRSVSPEMFDSPDKVKAVIQDQYGDLLPPTEKMDVGYFSQGKKLWIKNRLDVNDVWKSVERGERVTLWTMGLVDAPVEEHHGAKRKHDDDTTTEKPSKKKSRNMVAADERKALADDFEQKLEEKHRDKNYSRFQIKIWAEALASNQHTDMECPPAYAMFGRERKCTKDSGSVNETVMNGMLNVVNTLCQAIQSPLNSREISRKQATLSPVKKAELRGTYLKQLSELHQLHDAGILSEDEYEEQRMELIVAMRNLKGQSQ